MSDPSLDLLLQQLPEHLGNKLWFADEHHERSLGSLLPYNNDVTVLSNRFDIAQQSTQLGLNTHFNDWKPPFIDNLQTAFLRICKEKPVTNHLISQSYSSLIEGGKLIIVGQKNEGIKSYEKIANRLFMGEEKTKTLKKIGNTYIGTFTKPDNKKLENTDYHDVTEIAQWQGKPIFSKPGVYGWNKIDKGSETLIEHLHAAIKNQTQIESILDLGCGYGFLSIASAHITCNRRVATDNNAGALLCMNYNARMNELDMEVIAGNCGDSVNGKFDLILCNPPFHKGFDIDGDLTNQFLQTSHNKLTRAGLAVFVVNSFIPIEKKLAKYFSGARLIVNTGQFKVLALSL